MENTETWVYDLVFKDDASDKFWRIRREDKTLFTNFGRTGTKGTTTIVVHPTLLATTADMHNRAEEKLDKGYKPVTKQAAPTTPATASRTYTPPSRPSLSAAEYVEWRNKEKYPRYVPPAPVKTLPAYKATELDAMPDMFFSDLKFRVAMEGARRQAKLDEALLNERNAEKNAQIDGLQNVLCCCAHAMACRAALRWSAGHGPYGTTAGDGKPWNAYDGSKLARLVETGSAPKAVDAKVADKYGRWRLHSNPMMWTTKGDLKHWLAPCALGGPAEYLH